MNLVPGVDSTKGGQHHSLDKSLHTESLKRYLFNGDNIYWIARCHESIAQKAEGQMGYCLRSHEVKRNNNCFSNIQLVGQKIQRQNIFRSLKRNLILFFRQKHYKYGGCFLLQVGYNIQPSSISTNQNAAWIIDHQLDLTNLKDT